MIDLNGPPPCPDCGAVLTETIDTEDGPPIYLYECGGCGWASTNGLEQPLTCLTAAWSQALAAELEEARAATTFAQGVADHLGEVVASLTMDMAATDAVLDGDPDAPVEDGEQSARVLALREERDAARRDLARIVQLCGWDTDGNDPESPAGAFHLYDDGLQAARELLAERDEARAEVERLRTVVDAARLTASGDVPMQHLLSAFDDFDFAAGEVSDG